MGRFVDYLTESLDGFVKITGTETQEIDGNKIIFKHFSVEGVLYRIFEDINKNACFIGFEIFDQVQKKYSHETPKDSSGVYKNSALVLGTVLKEAINISKKFDEVVFNTNDPKKYSLYKKMILKIQNKIDLPFSGEFKEGNVWYFVFGSDKEASKIKALSRYLK